MIEDKPTRIHVDGKTHYFDSAEPFWGMPNRLLDLLQPEIELEPGKWFLVPGRAPRL